MVRLAFITQFLEILHTLVGFTKGSMFETTVQVGLNSHTFYCSIFFIVSIFIVQTAIAYIFFSISSNITRELKALHMQSSEDCISQPRLEIFTIVAVRETKPRNQFPIDLVPNQSYLPPVIRIEHITAAVDQLLHTEE